jgi:hypothetical protein
METKKPSLFTKAKAFKKKGDLTARTTAILVNALG